MSKSFLKEAERTILMNKCKDCAYYKRLKYHKSIDPNESNQLHGTCKLLKEVLAMNNTMLWNKDSLIVAESFGCILWKSKE